MTKKERVFMAFSTDNLSPIELFKYGQQYPKAKMRQVSDMNDTYFELYVEEQEPFVNKSSYFEPSKL